jgi:hypothetical protein
MAITLGKEYSAEEITDILVNRGFDSQMVKVAIHPNTYQIYFYEDDCFAFEIRAIDLSKKGHIVKAIKKRVGKIMIKKVKRTKTSSPRMLARWSIKMAAEAGFNPEKPF